MTGWWLLVFLAVFLIGLTKSGFGSGVGLMIIPMTAIALAQIPGRGAEAALGLLLPLLIIGDFIAIWQYRELLFPRIAPSSRATTPSPCTQGRGEGLRRCASDSLDRADATKPDHTVAEEDERHDGLRFQTPHPSPLPEYRERGTEKAAEKGTAVLDYATADRHSAWQIILRLAPGTLAGVVIGGLMLWWFHRQASLVASLMRIEIGLESVILVGLHWWRNWKGMQEHLVREPLRSHATGAFAGVSSTLAHAAGPIIAMYLLPLRLDRRLYVGTCAFFFFLLNTAKLPAYVMSHQFDKAEIPFTLKFLPLVIVGAIFGFWLNKRLSDRLFARVVYIITFVLGWYIMVDGIRLLSIQLGRG